MSLHSSSCTFKDFKSWKPILMGCLDKKKWGKHYKKIYTNFKVVDCGMKPSFLWDIGSVPAISTMKMLISHLKIENLLQSHIFLICSESEIFIVNKNIIIRILSDETFFKFMRISPDSYLPAISTLEDESLLKVLKKVIIEHSNEKNENAFSTDFSKLCSPKVFGIMLGYPVVYNVHDSNDTSTLNLIPLVSIKVFIDCNGESVEVYSFSHLLSHNLGEHIDKWYRNLKLDFKNFSFKLFKENVTANVVL